MNHELVQILLDSEVLKATGTKVILKETDHFPRGSFNFEKNLITVHYDSIDRLLSILFHEIVHCTMMLNKERYKLVKDYNLVMYFTEENLEKRQLYFADPEEWIAYTLQDYFEQCLGLVNETNVVLKQLTTPSNPIFINERKKAWELLTPTINKLKNRIKELQLDQEDYLEYLAC